MLYDAETRSFGSGPPNQHTPSWGVIGLARSSDNGATWTREGAVISGSDPKPDTNPSEATVFGVIEPGAIVANGYIYTFYSFFPLPSGPGRQQPSIQVARAPLSSDGSAGAWTKYYNGSFDSQPGLGGIGSPVVLASSGCSRPAQPWPALSTYLNEYMLFFVCDEGWFFSTSADLVNWSDPAQFYVPTIPLFTACQQNDDNYILVTPGNAGQMIGQTGYVLYADTPEFGAEVRRGSQCPGAPHELWQRPFTFGGGS